MSEYEGYYPDDNTDEPVEKFVREVKSAKKEKYSVNLILLILTLFTTTFVGAILEGANIFRNPGLLYKGLPYSITLMTILGSHELGHYLTARKFGVRATLPYFIPVPFFLGTFGAFIKMKDPVFSRRSLLYIGLAGPLTGFIFSTLAVYIGLHFSEIHPAVGEGRIILGEPLALKIISKYVFKSIPEGYDIYLNPIAFAGWIGYLVTAMNLFPIGQLDGGHVATALIPGGLSIPLSFGFIGLLIWAGIFFWPGWLVWALLNVIVGAVHPPVLSTGAMGRKDYIMGIITLTVFILSFTLRPVIMNPGF